MNEMPNAVQNATRRQAKNTETISDRLHCRMIDARIGRHQELEARVPTRMLSPNIELTENKNMQRDMLLLYSKKKHTEMAIVKSNPN